MMDNNKNIEYMEDFIYHDFKKCNTGGRKMTRDEFSLNITERTKTVTFNQDVSSLIMEMDLKKMRIMENRITGELYFLFNDQDGINVVYTGASNRNPYKPNVTFANKSLVSFLSEKLGVTEGRTVFRISDNLAKTSEYLTFKILGKSE